MRIVLDTNVLLQVIPLQSRFRPIWDAIKSGTIQVVMTTDIALEYEEILQQYLSHQIAADVLALLNIWPSVRPLDIYYNWRLIHNDPDDDKFVDAFVAGNAEYLITNDRHFNHLETIIYPPVQIISPSDFLKVLSVSKL